ncbi:ABC transporter permease [Acidisoma silvae]|uniref:ABC transporter permease n=1 Tax=Acidisoma silvae TaxID=2802396 RepID=A0A963YX51_9PROT|nr:ABC transporter permease [Acidisoma silvae]MCB8877992.1 ABC transporter permease [Acidisoma silvae]
MKYGSSALLLALFLALAIAGPAVAPYNPLAYALADRLQPPSLHHWFGTDALGRDVFSRTLAAARTDLPAAAAAVILSSLIGVSVGAACGYLGGAIDRWVGRVVDVMMAFPLFVVAVALVAALGNSLTNVVLATAVINLPFYIRLVRAEIAARRQLGYVMAARLAGCGHGYIIGRVLIPNIAPIIAVQISLNLGWAVLNTSGLSFIGLGVRPPTPEWGALVSDGAQYLLTGQWWVALGPSLVLVLAVFAFTLIGDTAHDLFSPRSAR